MSRKSLGNRFGSGKYFIAFSPGMVGFLLAALLLLTQCMSALKEKQVAEYVISDFSGVVTLPWGKELPKDVGVVVVTPDGYQGWDYALEENRGLKISLVLKGGDGTQTAYILSTEDTLGNCRLMNHSRPDQRHDIGWRLTNETKVFDSILLGLKDTNRIIKPPIKIRLYKLP